ncbi:MAG: GldG family protein [Deltaproteobacteria bacterium]|nr:GldG family protein [Deltaproteobacteria bacterium]
MKLAHWGRMAGPVGLVLLLASALTVVVAGDNWLGAINVIAGAGAVTFYLVTNLGQLTEQFTNRGTFYTTVSAVSTALLLGAIIAGNYLAVAHPKTWDVTQNKIHSLSDDTVKTVQGLKEPVEVLAFFKGGEPQAEIWDALFARYKALGDKLVVRTLDPEKEPVLVKEVGLTRGGPHVVVRQGKSDVKVATPTEEDLTNALVKVTHQTQRKIYFLDGHGEAGIDDKTPNGMTQLVERMGNEGLKAAKLPFGNGEVPTDAAAIVIAGPEKPLLPAEVAILRKYLEEGGRVIAMVEPFTPTGLEPLLKDWGVTIDDGVIVDQAGRGKFDNPFAAIGVGYGEHAVVKGFNLVTVYPQAASLSMTPAQGVNATPLVYTLGAMGGSPVTWVETNAGEHSSSPEGKAKVGPLNLAAVASKAAKPGQGQKRSDEGRLIVIGDHDFATNGNFTVLGNGDFALNCLNYMADQSERISIRPRQREASRLFLTATQMGGIRFFATELPIGLLAFGLAIFFNRRAK